MPPVGRWLARRLRQLPGLESYPNILRSLDLVQDYLDTKPKVWQDGTRFIATDFAAPDRARLKVYIRCFGGSFDDIWDFYTLGGRIPGMEEDKEKFRDLMNLLCEGRLRWQNRQSGTEPI